MPTATYAKDGTLSLAGTEITKARSFAQSNRLVPASMLPADASAMDRSYLLLAALRKQLDDGNIKGIKAHVQDRTDLVDALKDNLPATDAAKAAAAIKTPLAVLDATNADTLSSELGATAAAYTTEADKAKKTAANNQLVASIGKVVDTMKLPADAAASLKNALVALATTDSTAADKMTAAKAAVDAAWKPIAAGLSPVDIKRADLVDALKDNLPATDAAKAAAAIKTPLAVLDATNADTLSSELGATAAAYTTEADKAKKTAANNQLVASIGKVVDTMKLPADAAASLKDALVALATAAAPATDEKAAVDTAWKPVPSPWLPATDPVATISARIAEIDLRLQNQLNEVLHHPEFRRAEATWRGLSYLVMNTETGERLKLRVLNVGKEELRKDLAKAVDVDQSQLFKKVYEEEYGTFGGNPFSLLVGDYDFSQSAPDVEMLQRISGVAAAAHAPFIAAANPHLFGFESFAELGVPRDLSKIVEGEDWVKWRSFRDSEDSRYVALVLPRFLLRLPYDPVNNPVDGFGNFEELPAPLDPSVLAQPVDQRRKERVKLEAKWATLGPNADQQFQYHDNYLWGNAAYALAQRITNAFALHSWCAAIRGVEGGGKVEGLPVHVFRTGEKTKATKCPTEVTITDRREKELSDMGFISLCHCKNTDYAAFFGGATTQKPVRYNTPQATANARLSAALPYLLATSRFAHYLKVIMRDKVGSFVSRDTVSEYLNRWIADYVLLDDHAAQSVKAKYPLREARVDVVETPGKPGCYTATVFLRPHFQLEELTVSLRLVAELPPPLTA